VSKEPDSPSGKEPAKVDEPLKQQLEKAVGEIIPKQQRLEVIRRVEALVIKREQFSGPIAHPDHLKQYEEICPGAADRIIAMAERQQKAEIDFLAKEQQEGSDDRRLGMWLGFVAFLALIGAATFCGLLGHSILAGLFLAAGALSVVSLFLKRRKD